MAEYNQPESAPLEAYSKLCVERPQAGTPYKDVYMAGFQKRRVSDEMFLRRRTITYYVNTKAKAEAFVSLDGTCSVRYMGTDQDSHRAKVLDAFKSEHSSVETLYSGPNNTGQAQRDILCSDLSEKNAALLVVTTLNNDEPAGLPTLQLSSSEMKETCADAAANSVYAIPKQ